eukprot:2773145-Prymnesium_polylepis.1
MLARRRVHHFVRRAHNLSHRTRGAQAGERRAVQRRRQLAHHRRQVVSIEHAADGLGAQVADLRPQHLRKRRAARALVPRRLRVRHNPRERCGDVAARLDVGSHRSDDRGEACRVGRCQRGHARLQARLCAAHVELLPHDVVRERVLREDAAPPEEHVEHPRGRLVRRAS